MFAVASVGVAGAVALNIVTNKNDAVINSATAPATQTSITLGTEDLNSSAFNFSTHNASAKSTSTGGKVGVGAAVALISFVLLPPPSFQAGRAGNGHSILTLTPAAGLTFGGLSLEATW